MDYRQAGAFIKEAGKYGIVYGLDGIRRLMERLGNVQSCLRIIHVAGTNGKGSVCAMLAEILQNAGYRTGIYASPAVFEPEEIIKVQGENISKEAFAAIAGEVQAACRDMIREGLPHPTAFEVETAIAFCCFKKKECDVAVLETGLGGKQDATNLITHPVCSVLTSVSRDHMGLLGETLTEIAQAKAGIMKPGCPCVTAPQKPEVMKVFEHAASVMKSELRITDERRIRAFEYDGQSSHFEIVLENGSDAPADAGGRESMLSGKLPLAGAFQKQNLACVLETVLLLREKGFRIPLSAVSAGLSGVHLPGRFEQIYEKPDFFIDGAHNENAAVFLRETVQNCFTNRRIIYIIGVLADKEYEKLLQLMLPCADQVFTVTPDNPRALDGRELAEQAGRLHPAVIYAADVEKAAAMAMDAAGSEGVVLAFGSFSYLGELRQAVRDRIC